nr:hypothetical protein HK105_008237 [Polyrhizophydium stewartii]
MTDDATRCGPIHTSEVQLLRPLSPIAATASRLFFVHRYTDANCTTSQFHDLVYIYDKCGKLRDGVFAKTVFEGIGPGGKTTTQFYQAPTCTGTSFGFYTYVGRPADEKGSPVQPGIGNTPTGAGSGPAASGTGPVGSAGMPSGLDNTVSVCVQSGSINIRTSISFVLALAEDPAPSPSPSPTPIPAAARQRNTAMRTTAPWHLACIAAILVLYF